MKEQNENKDKILKVIETIIKKEEGKSKEFITLPIPMLFTKRLGSLTLIRLDIIYLIECAKELLIIKNKEIANQNKTIETSLWFSLLATYGKCFTSNKGGRTRIDEKDCFIDGTDDFKITHDEIITLRHGYIAHRDDTENEQAVIFMKINKENPQSELTEYNISTFKVISPQENKIHDYIKLLEYLLSYISNKIQKETEKVQEGFLNFLHEDTDNLYLKNMAF